MENLHRNKAAKNSAPNIWNPSAAASWCLLFSPIFGALIHSKNWIELEQPDRAKNNMIWVLVYIVFLILVDFIPMPPVVGFLLLIIWYFSQGRKQILFVKEYHRNVYQKKEWTQPILIAIGCLIGYLLLETITCIIILILFVALLKPGYRFLSSEDKNNDNL